MKKELKKSCSICLRRCKDEYGYYNDLDANGDKIDHNCWFQEGDYYWNFLEKDCPDFIENEDR